jgi:hypothetical protein
MNRAHTRLPAGLRAPTLPFVVGCTVPFVRTPPSLFPSPHDPRFVNTVAFTGTANNRTAKMVRGWGGDGEGIGRGGDCRQSRAGTGALSLPCPAPLPSHIHRQHTDSGFQVDFVYNSTKEVNGTDVGTKNRLSVPLLTILPIPSLEVRRGDLARSLARVPRYAGACTHLCPIGMWSGVLCVCVCVWCVWCVCGERVAVGRQHACAGASTHP